MFPRADIVGARPVASVEAPRPITPAGDAHQELAQRLNRIALGSFLEGEVLSRMQDGSFVVKVADTAVRMNLPSGAQVGETLDLTLVATQPRPTFLLGAPAPDNNASLSNAGRLVDWIIHQAQDTTAPATLTGKAPLAASPHTPPEQLASSMQDALEFSGLFYESHVEQWANGERPLAKLLAEPQAKNGNLQQLAATLRAAVDTTQGDAKTGAAQIARVLANIGTPAAAREAASDPAAFHAATLPQQVPADPAAQQERGPLPAAPAAPSDTDARAITTALPGTLNLTAGTASADAAPATVTAPAAKSEIISDEAVRTINLQLNTLEQQRVAWQGEIWPGQQMEWEIDEDTPQGRQGSEQERSWQSMIRFDLPMLGRVSATVRLAGEHVQIQVRTANEATASLLRAHGGALSAALAAAGSPLDLLTVKRDETA